MLYDTLPTDFNGQRLVRLGASKSHDSWPDWRITSFRRSCGDNMDQRPKFIDVCVSRHGGNDLGKVHTLRFWRHGPISLVTCAEKASIGAMDTMVMLGVTDHGGCKLCREVVTCSRAARGINHVYHYGREGRDFVVAWSQMVGHEHTSYTLPPHPRGNPSQVVRWRMTRDEEGDDIRRPHARSARTLTPSGVRSYYTALLYRAVQHDRGVVEAGYHKVLGISVFQYGPIGSHMVCNVQSGVTKNSWGRTQRSRHDKRLTVQLPIATVRNLTARGLLTIGGRAIGGIVEESADRIVAWCIKFVTPAAQTNWHKAVFVKPEGPNSAWTFSGWVRGGAL